MANGNQRPLYSDLPIGSDTVADPARRYDSLWKLRQGAQEIEQSYVQRVIKKSETFPFVVKAATTSSDDASSEDWWRTY